MLTVERLRELALRCHTHTPCQRHLSAASDLVCAHGRACVMADDEHALAVFRDAHTPGFTVPLLPAQPAWPQGALLALGSGSRPKRCLAACLALDARGQRGRPVRIVDLAPLYGPLRQLLRGRMRL